MRERERGQGGVEYIGLLTLLALACIAFAASGVQTPGASLARAIAARILCAVALAERCGDEPGLIAAYGTEVGELVRRHMPWLLYERGSRAVPVDFRRCRRSSCGDAAEKGFVSRTTAGLPVTAFVHVIDCRLDAADRSEVEGADCSGPRAGNLYLQYWTYYADSATLRGVPVVGEAGYHPDDWESVQIRVRPDGSVDQRASSHHGFNRRAGPANWGSDAGIDAVNAAAEAIGVRPENGWGPETGFAFVSGGSHAGAATGIPRIERLTPSRDVNLIPFEPIAARSAARFVVGPPWRKRVWRDPEAERTD